MNTFFKPAIPPPKPFRRGITTPRSSYDRRVFNCAQLPRLAGPDSYRPSSPIYGESLLSITAPLSCLSWCTAGNEFTKLAIWPKVQTERLCLTATANKVAVSNRMDIHQDLATCVICIGRPNHASALSTVVVPISRRLSADVSNL